MAAETKINVKSMISIFENQTVSEPNVARKRTKSVGHVSAKILVKRGSDNTPPPGKSLELAQIEHEVRHLQRSLGNYKKYSRENHIYYQNQIFFLLTDIVNVDAQDDTKIISDKSELIELMKRLNKGLNALLPSGVKRSKSEASTLKKEKSFEERKPQPPRIKESYEPPRVKENYEPPQKVEESEEEEREEVDAPAPSVKSLKQIFEQNVTDIELKREFGTKLTRKFNTFNSTSDSKYIPYSERFKTSAAIQEFHISETKRNFTEDTESSGIRTSEDMFESTSSYKVFSEEEEEKVVENDDEQFDSMEHLSRDSHVSRSDSDEEVNEKDDGLS